MVLQLSSVLRLWTILRTAFVQLTLLLHHWTILRISDATVRRPSVCFIPLYVSTHLRLYGSLCFYTTVRFNESTMLLYADCQFCFIPLYVSTTHFPFTPLYDSTNLRCCYTPTVGFVLYHCTFLRIYDATIRRLSVLFYTTVRFYASTFLRLTFLYATVRFYASTMLLYADCQQVRHGFGCVKRRNV